MLLLDSLPPPSWAQLFTGLGFVAFIAALAWFNWRRGSEQAGDRALGKYKALAEALEAENKHLREKVAELEKTVADQAKEIKTCDEFRNEVAQEFLRGAARERKYQTCINRLELKNGMEPTDFNDPTVHITEGFDRR